MKNYVNLMLVILCCFVYGVCGVRGDEIDVVKFKPCVETGMEWKVALTKMAPVPGVCRAPERRPKFIPHEITNVYIFVVEAVTNISGEECYQILFKIQREENENLPFRRLYIRCDDFTLKMIERWTFSADNPPQPKVELVHGYQRGPLDVTEWQFFPFGFPVFSNDPGRRNISIHGCSQKEEITRIEIEGKEVEALKITLEKRNESWGEKGVIEQTWVRGKPWWVKCVYYLDGKKEYTAKLVTK